VNINNRHMNSLNAFAFTALGMVMRVLPLAFPALFPRTGADEASTRALWMAFMGALQVGLGLAYLARAHAVPVLVRLISAAPSVAPGAPALPAVRGLTGR
jgi:hypothetical protein